jgi:hypothetical protein
MPSERRTASARSSFSFERPRWSSPRQRFGQIADAGLVIETRIHSRAVGERQIHPSDRDGVQYERAVSALRQ